MDLVGHVALRAVAAPPANGAAAPVSNGAGRAHATSSPRDKLKRRGSRDKRPKAEAAAHDNAGAAAKQASTAAVSVRQRKISVLQQERASMQRQREQLAVQEERLTEQVETLERAARIDDVCPDAGARRAYVEKMRGHLEKLPLFQSLPMELSRRLIDALEEVTYEKGQCIVKEGDKGKDFFLIVDGEVSITKAGQKAELARRGVGDYFGEASLETGAPTNASVTALSTPCKLVHLDADEFWQLVLGQEVIASRFRGFVARRHGVIEAKERPGWLRFVISERYTVEAKRVMVDGKKRVVYVQGARHKSSFALRFCAPPIVVLLTLLFCVSLHLEQTSPRLIEQTFSAIAHGDMEKICSVSANGYSWPSIEKPPFEGCDVCEEECSECASCYDAPSPLYDSNFNHCVMMVGACSWPFGSKSHCPEMCGPYLALGREGLECIPADSASGGNYTWDLLFPRFKLNITDFDGETDAAMYNEYDARMNSPLRDYRDPVVGTVQGVDPIGTQHGRKGPNVYEPKGYTPDRQWPLIIALHGLLGSGNFMYWSHGLRPFAHERGYLYMNPDAVRFEWCGPPNALHAPHCADHSQSPPVYLDDAAYIMSLIDEARDKYAVSKVFLFGFSNGAAMAQVLGCYFPDRIDGIISNAPGSGHMLGVPDHPTYHPDGCAAPKGPLHALFVHDPGDVVNPYSHAVQNMADFAESAGCQIWPEQQAVGKALCPEQMGRLDLLPRLRGANSWLGDVIERSPKRRLRNETAVWQYHGCAARGSSTLWTVDTWGSNTFWGRPGKASKLAKWMGSFGHMTSWAQANDQGVHYALAQRVLDWCDQVAAADEARGLRLRRRLAENASDTATAVNGAPQRRRLGLGLPRAFDAKVNQDCPRAPLWASNPRPADVLLTSAGPRPDFTEYEDANAMHLLTGIVLVSAGTLLLVLIWICTDCCMCASYLAQRRKWKKYCKQKNISAFRKVLSQGKASRTFSAGLLRASKASLL